MVLLKQQNIRTALLILSTTIYMLLGAAVFSALENETHQEQKKNYFKTYNRIKDTYNMSFQDIEDLAEYIYKRRSINWALEPWSYAGSVYFTSVTITTIGYGHSVPQTVSGQIFCMLYAIIGIPLNLTMFQAIGERMGVLMTSLLRRSKRILGIKNKDVTLIELVAFGLIIWTVFLCGGAAMFSRYERWGFFRSMYYFFVTLTTIGFGDFVALQDVNNPGTRGFQSKTLYITSTLIMIYVGLAIASSVINLLVIRLMELQQPKRRKKNLSWKSGPRCDKCRSTNGGCKSQENVNLIENHAVTILNNFEDELVFRSYKQLRNKTIS
ncbi:potassium channel subfamily K member 9 [Hydra vulgaris]|uniref:Potassium channel subfamily K member 9 n=1 Tax=Hydra vulgaris TaxID=6087 RepID=A0ABM4DA75_HYDVU